MPDDRCRAKEDEDLREGSRTEKTKPSFNLYSLALKLGSGGGRSTMTTFPSGGVAASTRLLVLRMEANEMSSPSSSGWTAKFTKFCSQTSLHGWQYLGIPSLPFSRRLLWTIMIVLSMLTGSYFIHWFVNGFLEDSVSTTIQTTTAPLSEVHFPAVTICNNNQISRSFLSAMGLCDDLRQSLAFAQEFIIGREDEITKEERIALHNMLDKKEYLDMAYSYLYGALQVNATNFESMLMNKRVSLSQVVLRLATQWEPGLMIPYAEYQGIVHSDSISTYYGTDHGICAKIHPQIFDSAHIVPDRPSAIRRKLDAPPGVKNGINNGMHFLLDAEVYDSADNRSASGGFKLALHHHLDIAVIRQLGINITPGTETQIVLTPTLETTTETARGRFSPEDRDCYFQSEISLRHWRYGVGNTSDPAQMSMGGRYSMTNCLFEAVMQTVPSECGCSPSFHMQGFNLTLYPSCLGTGIHCINKVLDGIGTIDTVIDHGQVKRSNHICCMTCNQYDHKVSYTLGTLALNKATFNGKVILDKVYPELCPLLERLQGSDPCASRGVFSLEDLAGFRQDAASRELLISQLYLYSRENLSLVRIFIKDPYVTKLRRDEAFSIILFVAGAGGLMGLCTGFSFLSGVEVIYHMFFGCLDLIQVEDEEEDKEGEDEESNPNARTRKNS